MRLVELEINNIRGIRHLIMKPDRGNIVIWGSNGSGKSAVVDAIDFLLTGRMSRLSGKGTGDINLEIHGVHIDCKLDEAWVRAIISIPAYEKPIEIKRCMDNSDALQYGNNTDKQKLEKVLSIALRGQHVLTRREILKYITAEPSDRAQGIQQILDLRDVEEFRKTTVKVENESEKELNKIYTVLTLALGEVTALTGEKSYTIPGTLECINKQRWILKAQVIAKLESSKVKHDVDPPTTFSADKTINITQLKLDIDAVNVFQHQNNIDELSKVYTNLCEQIQSIKDSPQLLKSFKRLNIMNLGLELLEEDGVCPLCDTPWPFGQLRKQLEQHVLEAKTAGQYQVNITSFSKSLSIPLSNIISKTNNIIDVMGSVGPSKDILILRTWVKGIQEIITLLINPLANYSALIERWDKFGESLKIYESQSLLACILQSAELKFPKTTPEMEAWDTLTKLETRLGSLEKTRKQVFQKTLFHKRASQLSESFLLARDTVLKELYDSVRDRFVSLYLQIHGTDESQFKADIRSDKAGIDFKVDFYGRGQHPPHALHSEGHQDSMGLCLYLALAERLTKGIIDLIILDDVVMSVDADHRRNICEVLLKSFPDNQFLITTHDRTWANQLRMMKIVDSKGMTHFYNWHVATGPQVDFDADIWGRISQDLLKEDVSSAAGKLRQNSEQYFALVCDSLQAPVVFKITGTFDLGNLLDGAIRQYFSVLHKAKSVAQSWGNNEQLDKFQEFESVAKDIYKRTNAEQWQVNPAIHYTKWENFSKKDFQPVVDSFRDLYTIFTCSRCGGLLRVTLTGFKQEAVVCGCGQVYWSLIPQPKSK
jgi:recombinational DNA repair ATPase RecF